MPENWRGWPERKQFAFVLTHDVDTKNGYEHCMQLAELEENAGFRSSFNFVAEDFDISMELLDNLASRGFEIGLHSVHHENLFKSRNSFRALLPRINEYLKKWNAVGFRSPSMYHNLEWIHELDIEYDASTFDTDPFEPQPDSTGTVFPFWTPNHNGSGYVELPYTLPQDFLLFVLMRQKNTRIWKEKLDWIAKHGGMALFITHPDYMIFDNKRKYDKYSCEYYRQFLTYVKTKYEGQYWSALPRDVARFWNANYAFKHQVARKPKRICMLAYSFYKSDNRIMRYAEALSQRGDIVDVIALRRDDESPMFERLRDVNLYRIQKRTINEKRKLDYILKLLMFFIRSSVFLTRQNHRHPYDVIHVHSVPDFEVFAAVLPKLFGSKIILDIHDIVPEFYASKFSNGKENILFRSLMKLEQLSSSFADHVIISNHIWHERLVSR